MTKSVGKEENKQAKKTDGIRPLVGITARSAVRESEELRLEYSLQGPVGQGYPEGTEQGQ